MELNGVQYQIDDKGYLTDISQWDSQLRDWLAGRENIVLTAEHLQVIDFLRKYYQETGVHPAVRMITAGMAESLGKEKATVKYFHVLFPAGLHQAFMIAGLPMKQNCC
jgi:tRNA 2-thiouridine synthesizing protein E